MLLNFVVEHCLNFFLICVAIILLKESKFDEKNGKENTTPNNFLLKLDFITQ